MGRESSGADHGGPAMASLLGAPGEDRAAGRRARLDWTDLEGHARSLDLDGREALTIGRSADNALVLREQAVSRHHATLAADADGAAYILTDLGSSNGTLLNDQPLVAPAELRSGDRFTIGGATFTFTSEEPPAAAAIEAAPHVMAAALAPDGYSTVNLSFNAAGWLELPNGERRILGGETRIGRSAKNDITIDDNQVSRNHAHIRRIDNRFVLSDLGSVNGVQVNGEPVLTPRELADGDRIEIGSTVLRFSLTPFTDSSPGFSDHKPAQGDVSATSLFSLTSGAESAAMKGDLREVTVLFTDMHGFTAMSERLNNPELTTRIINQVFELLTAEIVRYDGSIDKFSGDNIMALFGAPRAHEDDPERAIRAALAMQRALGNFNRRLRRELGLTLQMRTGINTGEVLFGQVGGGNFRSYTVMGDTVNLASRLEHAARVGYILVGEATYALTRHAFHFTTLPPMDIKGKREPVQAYEVVREKRADEVLREPDGVDYLIGRESELQQLRVALEDVQNGQGRLLAVIGDIGIGKSQLLAAFRRSFGDHAAGDAAAGATWIVERCLSYEATAPYSLLSGVLRSLLGLDCEEALDRARLLSALKTTLPALDDETRAEYLALLGEILGVRINNAFIAGLEAKVRRKLVTAMVRALVAARVRASGGERPLVLMLEEMQWADSASVDALDELVDALPGLPVLLLLTYRPEWSHAWSGRSFYRQVNLGELNQEQSRRFLRQVLQPATLPDAVADAIFDQCGGNPLLLEETVKSLRERGALVARKGQWALTADVSLLNMPSTLRGMMMTRLDRLSDQERTVLQRAAVIGRSFTYRLLALVTGMDDSLDDSLAALKDQELIVENALAAEPEYRFKHTIIQEIAYNNVLAADRRVLHERIGAAIEQILAGSDRDDDQVEVLAHHYSRSGAKLKAAEYLMRAGEKARQLYANKSAIEQFEEALEKLQSLPPAELTREPTSRMLMRLHEVLGDVYLLTANFRRAQVNYEAGLATAAGAKTEKARLWNQLGLVWERRGDYRKALGSYEQGMALFAPTEAVTELAALRASAARAHAQRGDYATATTLANAALAGVAVYFGPEERRIRADALHVLGLTAYAGGNPDEALDHFLQSLKLRQDLGDTMGMQESYNELGAIYWSRGQITLAFKHLISLTAVLRLNASDLVGAGALEPGTGPLQPPGARDGSPEAHDAGAGGDAAPIERYYRSGITVAQQVGDLWGVAVSGNRLGQMLFQQGEHERALGHLRRAVTEADRIGAREVAAEASIHLGAILVGRGEVAAGLRHLERGIAYAEAIESAVVLAEGDIRLAEGKQALGDLDGALAAAQNGMVIAARIGHRLALGRAHRALGRVFTGRADWRNADHHFRQALDLFNGLDAQQEIGRTLFDFAAMWHAWSAAGHGPIPEGATVMLQQAAQIFAQLDMQADLRAARAALIGRDA